MAKVKCEKCNDSGFIIIRDNKNRQYATACDCPLGNKTVYDGRTIVDEKHRSEYIIPKYSAIMPKP